MTDTERKEPNPSTEPETKDKGDEALGLLREIRDGIGKLLTGEGVTPSSDAGTPKIIIEPEPPKAPEKPQEEAKRTTKSWLSGLF